MAQLIIPKNYSSYINLKGTENAIKAVKDYFENTLAYKLNLQRVSAPLFLPAESGLNDNLSGSEKAITFTVGSIPNEPMEIIHSLAKWKRMALRRYHYETGEGLYTDMNALRTFEELDNLHSVYVDQWDWEKIIAPEDCNFKFLKKTVETIYDVFKDTELFISHRYPKIKPILPEKIHFISTQELEDKYPQLSPKERENRICRKYGAVFVHQIGDVLASGQKHDGRSPDYDDWTLNGDILLWSPVIETAVELSSMGIRVNPEKLKQQLKKAGCEERLQLDFHKKLAAGELPQTMGGGIGQSRICMFFLRKAHIGEVQSSLWPEDMVKKLSEHQITLL